MDRIKKIDETIVELENKRKEEEEREQRILKQLAGFYAGRERGEKLTSLPLLLTKAGLKHADINEFYAAEEHEARQIVEVATPQLQLTTEELASINRETRAILLINPCAMVRHSPGYVCVRDAASCYSTHWTTDGASASCTCDTPNEELNPKAVAYGQGSAGWRVAYVHCGLYFVVPARPNWTTVWVDPWIKVHGFRIVKPATGSAVVYMKLEAKGIQYGYSWGGAEQFETWHGDMMSRYDVDKHLNFEMAVAPDPWYVRVSVKLWAYALGGGAMAVTDFATGVGNVIKTIWVNTYSTD